MKMKKKSTFLIAILLVSLVPIILPTVIAVTPTASFHNNSYRAELALPYDVSTTSTKETLPEVTPFWVDLVDAEFMENEGEGVYVAVLDTGLMSNWPFLFSQANIAWELGKGFTHDVVYWDYTIEDFVWDPATFRDNRGFLTELGSGHGTHVASTIVGFNVNNWYWVRGVAPKATIIPVLVLDGWYVDDTPWGDNYPLEAGSDLMVAEGINYAASLVDQLDAPLIISMSLGDDVPVPIIEDAINNAIEKGAIVVASAGNAGYEGMGWPGAYPQVISCAMGGWTEQFVSPWWGDVPEKLNTKDLLGNNWQTYLHVFSSRPNKDLGQKSFHLDVTTPGAAIVGPFKLPFSNEWDYYYLWGTSMSAPHVSGIASLVLEEYPYVEQAKMEKILKNAAHGCPLPADGALVYDIWDPVNEVVDWNFYFIDWYGSDYGAGFLQADAALKSAAKFA